MKGLTKRDMRILESINSFGFLTSSQIRNLHFLNINKKTAQRRLAVLRNKGLIDFVNGLSFGEYAWRLTPKSAKLLGADLVIHHLNKNLLYHDTKSNNLRILIEKNLTTAGWVSSHYLKHKAFQKSDVSSQHKNNIPDWLCRLDTKIYGKVLTAIELELSLKSRTRMIEILSSYKKREDIKLIWYVVPHERFGKKLFRDHQSIFRSMPKGWFCFSILSELESDFLNCRLHFNHKTLPLFEFMNLPIKPAVTSAATPLILSEEIKLTEA